MPRFSFTDRAAPVVQIGIGDARIPTGSSLWDTARWDTPGAVWSGDQPFWLDMTCEAFEMEFVYGRARNTDTFAPGTATLVFTNITGWADPKPPAGNPASQTMRPGRAIRIGVNHDTLGTVWLWRGFIDAVIPTYDPAAADVVNVSAVCALGEVGRAGVAAVDPPVGAGEAAHVRVHRVLDAVPWSQTARVLYPTSTTMLATPLGGQAADLLGVVAESTGGAVYGDTGGNVVFRNPEWQVYDVATPPDATIGNVAPGDVCPSGWELSSRRDDIITRVSLARFGVDTVPFVWNDVPGQVLYGVETWEARDVLCQEYNTMALLAARMFRTRGHQTTPRVERVTLAPATGDAVVDLATAASVFRPSRYRCRLLLARGQVFDADMFVTETRHTMTPDDWTCELGLDWSAPFSTPYPARWDTARWDADKWSAAVVALLDEARALTGAPR